MRSLPMRHRTMAQILLVTSLLLILETIMLDIYLIVYGYAQYAPVQNLLPIGGNILFKGLLIGGMLYIADHYYHRKPFVVDRMVGQALLVLGGITVLVEPIRWTTTYLLNTLAVLSLRPGELLLWGISFIVIGLGLLKKK